MCKVSHFSSIAVVTGWRVFVRATAIYFLSVDCASHPCGYSTIRIMYVVDVYPRVLVFH